MLACFNFITIHYYVNNCVALAANNRVRLAVANNRVTLAANNCVALAANNRVTLAANNDNRTIATNKQTINSLLLLHATTTTHNSHARMIVVALKLIGVALKLIGVALKCIMLTSLVAHYGHEGVLEHPESPPKIANVSSEENGVKPSFAATERVSLFG